MASFFHRHKLAADLKAQDKFVVCLFGDSLKATVRIKRTLWEQEQVLQALR